jgi:hypothetical protein
VDFSSGIFRAAHSTGFGRRKLSTALRVRAIRAALVAAALLLLGEVPTARAGKNLTSRASRAEAAFVRAGLPHGSAYVEAEGSQLRVLVAGVGEGPSLSLDTPGWLESLGSLVSRSGAPAGAKPSIVVQLQTAQRMEADVERMLRQFDVWAFDGVLAPFPVRASSAGVILALRPSLHLPLGRTPIPYELPWILDRPLAPERTRVVGAFGPDHADAAWRLAQAAGTHRTSAIEGLLDQTGAVSLRGHDGEILLIVGHIEKNSFVIQKADGSIARTLPLDPIKAEAARHNASVIFLGCDSYSATRYNGLVGPTSDIYVSRQIESALSEKTLGGFLSRLGTPAEPFVISRESLSANRATVEFASRRTSKKVAAAAGGVVVVRVAASRWIEHGAALEELGSESQPSAPTTEAR